jgi:signal transduction histidine kinase/DNA-binding NarL/FixJ family response regulator
MWSAPGVDGDAFGQAGAGMVFPPGAGLPGRTWAENRPVWVRDVHLDPEFRRAAVAGAQGFHAAFTFPIRAAGEVTGVMLFLSRDVRPADPLLLDVVADLGEHIGQFAERKRMETVLAQSEQRLRQAQRLEGLGRLAGGVAHDFNNLLTVIIGRSALLQSAVEESSPLRRHADIVHATAERAAALTRQLLAFSRQQMLEARVLDVGAVVAGLAEMLARLIREDIALGIERAPDLWSVRADPTQLEQVIMNLVVNARDAMPRDGRISIRTANVEVSGGAAARHPGGRPGSFVLLEVTDTGMGMSPEVQARIFEPFFTTKELGRGTGLGLATTWGIVRQHEGWIEVQSQPGHGTTFAIYLPRVEAAEAAGAGLPAAEARLTGSETILLAEDEEDVRTVLVEMLETLGYRVIAARGPAEALEHAERLTEPIHLLLTDVVMPGMRGPELARVLTALRPELRVLYISGHADDAVFSAGAVPEGITLLPKPFTPETLGRSVREVLDRPACRPPGGVIRRGQRRGATTTSVGLPLRKLSTLATARRSPSRTTSAVWPALCGEQTTLGSERIGSSGASGSWWKTSRPAPRMRRSRSATRRASRSTSAPRPVLTRMAEGLMSAISLRPMKPRVSGVSRTCRLTTSAWRRISSLPAGRAPAARTRRSSPRALQPRTSMPMPRPSAAMRPPIVPMPKTPRVLPRHWVSISRGQRPARISRSRRVIFRATASMRASACSATAKAFTAGVLQTVTPRMPAALRSTLSVPVPHTETSLSAGQAAKTASVKRAWARMFTATRALPMRRISSASSSAPRSE